MKRKIFGILFAVVLVLSLSLVTAVPVSAYEVHDSSPDSNNSWTCEAAGPLIWAKVQAGMTEDEAAASFASGKTNCEIRDLAVSGQAVVGSPVTVTGTVDMTAWVQCIGWNYDGVEVWASSWGYARVRDTGGSEVAFVESPSKWSDHAFGVDEYGWWFHVDTNDESQVFDFSITFTPTHTGEYTLFAGGRVNAGYWSDARGQGWFPHPPDPVDYGRRGGVTVSCEDSLAFEVGSILVDIDHAKLDFKKKADDDKVRVQGKLALAANGYSVDIGDHVTVTLDSVSHTITMEEKGKKGEKWQYKRPKGSTGNIKHMTINWKNGKFDIRMDKAELTGITNPVTISIQIGDDVGEETILMREKKHHWNYKAK